MTAAERGATERKAQGLPLQPDDERLDSLARIMDRAEARLTPCEQEAVQDPNCRFASNPLHVCTRRDGRLCQSGDECFAEQRAQITDQGPRDAA